MRKPTCERISGTPRREYALRMRTVPLSAIALLQALAAAPAAAETYKWVDARGVVNYSSTPPPAVAAKPQVIEERVSVIPPDPSIGPAAAALQVRLDRRAQFEEAEFARRQQYMLDAQMMQMNYTAAADAYAASTYYPYYGYGGWGYLTGGSRRWYPHATPYRALPKAGVAGRAHSRPVARGGRGAFR
jgi:hypothetical protein